MCLFSSLLKLPFINGCILQVAMSKVVWLEEHRATRQTAIDNAVRLAEAELKQRMEAEVEAKVEKRLQEGKP